MYPRIGEFLFIYPRVAIWAVFDMNTWRADTLYDVFAVRVFPEFADFQHIVSMRDSDVVGGTVSYDGILCSVKRDG